LYLSEAEVSKLWCKRNYFLEIILIVVTIATKYEEVDWINLAYDMVQVRALVNTVMKIWVP
jgi:hypothetical protein